MEIKSKQMNFLLLGGVITAIAIFIGQAAFAEAGPPKEIIGPGGCDVALAMGGSLKIPGEFYNDPSLSAAMEMLDRDGAIMTMSCAAPTPDNPCCGTTADHGQCSSCCSSSSSCQACCNRAAPPGTNPAGNQRCISRCPAG